MVFPRGHTGRSVPALGRPLPSNRWLGMGVVTADPQGRRHNQRVLHSRNLVTFLSFFQLRSFKFSDRLPRYRPHSSTPVTTSSAQVRNIHSSMFCFHRNHSLSNHFHVAIVCRSYVVVHGNRVGKWLIGTGHVANSTGIKIPLVGLHVTDASQSRL